MTHDEHVFSTEPGLLLGSPSLEVFREKFHDRLGSYSLHTEAFTSGLVTRSFLFHTQLVLRIDKACLNVVARYRSSLAGVWCTNWASTCECDCHKAGAHMTDNKIGLWGAVSLAAGTMIGASIFSIFGLGARVFLVRIYRGCSWFQACWPCCWPIAMREYRPAFFTALS